MPRVRLVHWNATEAEERAERLRSAGYEASFGVPAGVAFLRELRKDPPAAVVIDLSRLPMQGRDIGLVIRRQKALRHLPLVFVGGEPEKVTRVRKSLPDAVYATWAGIRGAIRSAVARPPKTPVVPASGLAGYSGTPLAQKLGIKAGTAVGLVGAPAGFRKTLGSLPPGVTFRGDDLVLWFVRSHQELDRGIAGMAKTLRGSLWICWPKKTSPLASDLTQQRVRDVGLASGLVDYKIAAIDATWSGLKFTRRRR